MKKNVKKALVISILSMGILSLAPVALCAPGDVNGAQRQPSKLGNDHIMIPAFRLSKTDLKNFLCVSKKTGSTSYKFKVNPVGISSRQDIRLFVPNIETFEDHHKLTPDEDRNNHVNSFNEGNINTLIYYPGSFDAERFRTILEVNGVDSLTPESENTNLWKCEVQPFNGKDYRVEYTKKLEKNEEVSKKIVFLFRPIALINKTRSIIKVFNKLVNDCGLKRFINNTSNDLKNVVIPRGVKEIGGYNFAECGSLQRVTIPKSVKSIGKCAFRFCASLKKIEIPEDVESLGEASFSKCYSLKQVNIPNNVTEINSYTFNDCTSLRKIEIPESVTSIGEGAFMGCRLLKEIEIPSRIRSIRASAFDGCTSLKIRWNEKVYDTVAEFFADFNIIKGYEL